MDTRGDEAIYILDKPNVKGKARALIMDIYLRMNKDNLINKGEIAKSISMCNRTFNKYWKDTVNSGLLIKAIEPKIWMVNPKYVRYIDVSDKSLQRKWEELVI